MMVDSARASLSESRFDRQVVQSPDSSSDPALSHDLMHPSPVDDAVTIHIDHLRHHVYSAGVSEGIAESESGSSF